MTTPALILQGNKNKSKQWIPWAEAQLARHKALGHPVINQALKPVNCVVVHIRSVNGNDFIRIDSCVGGGWTCRYELVPTCPAPCSDFQLWCRPSPLETTKDEQYRIGVWTLPRTQNPALVNDGGDWHNYEWSVDSVVQSSSTSSAQKFFPLAEPGTYEISLKVKLISSEPLGSATVTHVLSESKNGGGLGASGASQALAQAEFDAATWMDYGQNNPSSYRLVTGKQAGVPWWSIAGTRTTYRVDLVLLNPLVVQADLAARANITGAHGRTFKSSLGAVGSAGNPSVAADDVIPLIGTAFNVTYIDSDDWSAFPTVPEQPSTYSEQWALSTVRMTLQNPPVTITELRTTKTVDIKASGYRQIGNSVHEVL